MAALAMGLDPISLGSMSHASASVLARSDGFKVIGIYAASNTANVINLKSIRNDAFESLIR